jgi:8-oxo-dGTP diphosphatase
MLRDMSPDEKFFYEYPRPAFTVDGVIFTYTDELLKVLLIKRADLPFKDSWAFPGGFVNEGEDAETAVQRELLEETGLKDIQTEQFWTATKPGRDPRGWTISVAFIGFTSNRDIQPVAGDDAKEVNWFDLENLPPLAFDHNEIMQLALTTVKTKMRFILVSSKLLQASFSKEQFLMLGKSFGFSENNLKQRLNRFERAGVIKSSGEKDCFQFDAGQLLKLT